MSDDDLDNLVPFPRRTVERNRRESQLEELPVRPAKWNVGACKHLGSTVDRQARRVFCRSCNVELDPIDVLHRLAEDREQGIRSAQRWRAEADSLMDTVARLRKDETNAKSRIRSARRRRGDDALVEEAARAVAETRNPGAWDRISETNRETARRDVRVCVEAYGGAAERLTATG